MASSHMKRRSASLISGECNSKPQYHLTPVRVAVTKKSTHNNCWQGCREKRTLLHGQCECKLMQLLRKTVWRWSFAATRQPCHPCHRHGVWTYFTHGSKDQNRSRDDDQLFFSVLFSFVGLHHFMCPSQGLHGPGQCLVPSSVFTPTVWPSLA